jgi:hypothetical protein
VAGRRVERLEIETLLEHLAYEAWLRDIALRGIDAQRGMHIVTITTSVTETWQSLHTQCVQSARQMP